MGISNIASNLRPGICTSSTRPTTPYEGQVIYETDTNRTLVWDNAAWISLAQSAGSGLVKIKPTSVSGTGASLLDNGTVKVSSGGTTFTIVGCFNADFESYEVVVSNYKPASGTQTLALQLRTGTTTSATGYYYAASYGSNNYSGTASPTTASLANQTSFGTDILSASDAGFASGMRITIINPFLAVRTSICGLSVDARTGGNARLGFSGFHDVATSYDQLVFVNSNSVNITSATVQIYGYN